MYSISSSFYFHDCANPQCPLPPYILGNLPWQGLKASDKKKKYEKIKEKKRTTTLEELCEGYPAELVAYFAHIRSIEFNEKPNYQLLKTLLSTVWERERYGDRKSGFDWERKTLATTGSTSSNTGVCVTNNASPRPAQPQRNEHSPMVESAGAPGLVQRMLAAER